MRFYLNELSLEGLPTLSADLEQFVRLFVKRCVLLKSLGFKELRSHQYPLNVELAPGMLLATWVKDREHGDRDLKSKFKNLSLNSPLFHSQEINWQEAHAWSKFSYDGVDAMGLGAAYLAGSLTVSFPTKPEWSDAAIRPVVYQYYNHDDDEIQSTEVHVKNVSAFNHLILNKEHCIQRLKNYISLDNWKPESDNLPNVDTTNGLLKIEKFYNYFQHRSRGEKISLALSVGEKVAELNNYSYDKRVSKLNTDAEHLREIYVSNNLKGKKTYLSIDVEKAAFEVCDYQGVHQKEILFSGKQNGGQELDHSIRLK